VVLDGEGHSFSNYLARVLYNELEFGVQWPDVDGI
jgi:hypothetical protein